MSRRGENIYKRKDGRWEGRFIRDRTGSGKAVYGYIYGKSYREVKEKMLNNDHLIRERETASNAVTDEYLFGNVAEVWLYQIKSQVKESTLIKYRNLLKTYILPAFSETPIEKLTSSHIGDYCAHLLNSGGCTGKGLSPKTVADSLSLIRNILKYASACGYRVNFDVKSVSVKQTPKDLRVLSQNEQEQLCSYLYSNLNRKNLGILICLFTGMRVGEICALRWEDISLTEGTLYIQHSMQRIQCSDNSGHKTKIVITTPKSKSSIRTIPLPDSLAELISAMPGKQVGFFLTGSDRQWIEPRTMQNHFKRVLNQCSIKDANYHALRHTFATRCIEVGFDVKSLSEILGHANVNITMNRYVHPSMELKRKNMQRLSSLLAVK